ncbi:MAG: site-2 protease family protein [Syntrophobacteraceae bacterium]|nr:site-2 protease family protein [Syntrophobacteraceae bacterium]
METIGNTIARAALYAVPLLLAVIAHEVAHGWVAEKRGDPTARRLGRITLNPLVHIDPVGTLILPAVLLLLNAPFLFGWARPVPVQTAHLRNGRQDMALVAAAGPMTNFLLAALSAGVFRLLDAGGPWGPGPWESTIGWVVEPLRRMAEISVEFNLVLMVINLLPIPPLDGGRVLAGLVPSGMARALDRLEGYGMLIVLILIGTQMWGYIVSPVLRLFMYFFLG